MISPRWGPHYIPRTDLVADVSTKRKRGLFNNLPHPSSPSLAGKSSLRLGVAQGKRLAAKRRHQLQHKRHLKG